MWRLRIRFNRGEELKYISHLDIIRLWERALHRARIQLAYSEGFNPRPRFSLALPLAVGVTSEAELMDVFVTRMVSPHWFTAAVNQQLPPGIEIIGVYQIGLDISSLQSQVRLVEYTVKIKIPEEMEDVDSELEKLLSLEHLPWYHQRDTGRRNYDLRALIDNLWVIESRHPYCDIGMRLCCDSSGSGRPEQVTLALGFTDYPKSIHRTKIILETKK